MPSDAKFGLAIGMIAVLLISLLFFRREGTGELPAAPAAPKKAAPPPAKTPPPAAKRFEPPSVPKPPVPPAVEEMPPEEPPLPPPQFGPMVMGGSVGALDVSLAAAAAAGRRTGDRLGFG